MTDPISSISPAQCRAARALANLSQDQLATEARVGASTVRNFEAGRSFPVANNLDAILRVFASHGVLFLMPGEQIDGGAGVRLSGAMQE